MSKEQETTELTPGESTPSTGECWVQTHPDSLMQTKRGMDLVYFGIGLVVVSALLALYLLLTSRLPVLSLQVLPLVGLAGYLMIFLGPIFCFSIPEESECRGILAASAIGLSANLILFGTDYFDPAFL